MTRDGDLAERLTRAGVTRREAEILSLVAQRLRNREIAEHLYVSVRTVETHVAALLRKLDLRDRAALVKLGGGQRLTMDRETALPAPLTSLVGREHETNELAELLEGHRLVTLIGPGGVGKTRLAIRVATVCGGRFPDGVRVADLAPVGTDLVADTFARAFGVVPRPGWPVRDVLRDVAGGLRTLLLVDNCEHVVAATADIVAELLTAAPDVHVLATSREPLGVPGEVTYSVPAMTVPSHEAAARADTAASFDAIRLFVDRAATASPSFTLTDAIAPAVAALCQRLDGIPLAIELAASRVRRFSPPELVEHMDRRFDLLSAGVRSVPARHRTLRAAIDWSYDLLDDDERAFFDRLGVFPADFDFEAAEAMCTDDDLGGDAAVTLLPRLVDKSLVSVMGQGTRRYRLLETVRTYAAGQLSASGFESTARRRHASHYLALAEQAASCLRTVRQRDWLDRLTTELPNIRTALAHDITATDSEAVWRWVAALQRFCDLAGHRREATAWIDQASTMDEPRTSAVVAGIAAASEIVQPSDARAAFDLAQRAARLATGLDDLTRGRAARAVGMGALWIQPDLVLPALHEALTCFGADQQWESALTMQCLTQATGDLTDALQFGASSVQLFRDVGDRVYAANTLFIMAQRCIYAGEAGDQVDEWLTESRDLADASGSEENMIHATVGFGQLHWLRGDHAEAAALMGEVLPTLRRLGDQRCSGRALQMLGQYAYEQNQRTRAQELLRDCVEAVSMAGQSFVLVTALETLAAVQSAQGRHRQAAILLGAAHTARQTASAHMRPLQPPDDHLRRVLTDALGSDAFNAAHTAGEHLSATEAIGELHTDAGSGDPDL